MTQVITANGAQFYVDERGAGMPLVFLHGFSFDSDMWLAQLDYFARDYRVLAYDARGFGRSSLPTEQPWSALADLDAIVQQRQADPVVLLAHSMAAITACDYCLQYPSRVRALVLVSPAVAGFRWPESFMAQWAAYQELAAVDMDAARRAWMGSELFVRACAEPSLSRTLDAMLSRYAGWHWLHKTSVSGSEQPWSAFTTIAQPVLLVGGREDSPAFLDCAALLARQIPHACQLLIDDADHLCNMEQVAVFNRRVAAFLADV
jgi:3-oxoadipate enol-lactonase